MLARWLLTPLEVVGLTWLTVVPGQVTHLSAALTFSARSRPAPRSVVFSFRCSPLSTALRLLLLKATDHFPPFAPTEPLPLLPRDRKCAASRYQLFHGTAGRRRSGGSSDGCGWVGACPPGESGVSNRSTAGHKPLKPLWMFADAETQMFPEGSMWRIAGSSPPLEVELWDRCYSNSADFLKVCVGSKLQLMSEKLWDLFQILQKN